MKKKIVRITVIFFLVMLVLTVVSKKADEFSKASVTVAAISSFRLDYSIQVEGSVEREGIVSVGTLPEQVLEKIYVSEGEQVTAGSELFSVSLRELESKISQKIREIERLNMEISDATSVRETEIQTWQVGVNRANEDYQVVLNAGNLKVSQVEAQIDEEYQKSQAEVDDNRIKELGEALRVAKEERDSNALAAKQALEAASIPLSADSQVSRLTLDLDEKQMLLKELEDLKEVGGKVLSPIDGVIAKVNCELGSITSYSSVLLITELSSNSQLRVPISEEQRLVLQIGDCGMVEGINGSKDKMILDDAEIISIQKNSETEQYEMIVDLKDENFTYGSNAVFHMDIKSQQYSSCLPLSALRSTQGNGYYVLVVEELNQVLGTELVLKQINVDVIEKNSTMVALAEGAINSSQRVVTESSKAIEHGSRIKIIESNHNE